MGSRSRERGGDGNCTDNWRLLYKDNTRIVVSSIIELQFHNVISFDEK